MRKDDLGGHTAEDEGLREAPEHEVVIPKDDRVRTPDPGACCERVNEHGRPLEEDGGNG